MAKFAVRLEQNPKAYGAVADGAADDRAAINSAAIALPAGGGDLYFPPGIYLVGSNLTLGANVHLIFAKGAMLKVATAVTVTINGRVTTGAYQIFSLQGTGIISFGGTYQGERFVPQWWGAVADGATDDRTAINAAASAIPTGGGDLQFPPGTYLLGSNMTFASNVRLVFSIGATLKAATAVTVTISGKLDAPLGQIFSLVGTGVVIFTASSTREVFPQWWGAIADGSTDASPAFNAAIVALGTPIPSGVFGGTVRVPKGSSDYACASAIIMKDRVNLVGDKDATLKATANPSPSLISFDQGGTTTMRCRVSHLRLEGNAVANYGIVLTNVNGSVILEYLEVNGFLSVCVDLRGGVQECRFERSNCVSPSGGYSIRIQRQGAGVGGNNANRFVSLQTGGAGTSVYIQGDCWKNLFVDCVFADPQGGAVITGDGIYTPRQNKFDSCWFERFGATGSTRGLQITDVSTFITNPSQTVIQDCHFGVYDLAIYLQYASKTTMRNLYFSGNATNDINIASTASDSLIEGGVYDSAGIGDFGIRTIKTGSGFQNIVLSSTFVIDSTGLKTITIAHGLTTTPAIEKCSIHVVKNTNVMDWAYNLLFVDSVDATNVVVKINVSTQSATGGATAKIGLRVG